jgi:hypothetical protein
MITAERVISRGVFGDLVIDVRNPDAPVVTNAPDLTRIELALLTLAGRYWPLTVDGEGICVAGVVWYRPIEVTPDGLTLICQKIRDVRPLVEQAKEGLSRVR